MGGNEALARLSIHSLEGPRVIVTAMFNPKEIQVDKAVPWRKAASSVSDQPSLEFSSAEGRSMSFELMFDGVETATNVHTEFIAELQKLTQLRDADGAEQMRRPPKISVRWSRFPEFQGVIESMTTTYSMFLPNGTPVRATCQLRIREAGHLAVAK